MTTGHKESPPQIVSSEGALYVILPYDYTLARPLFEHTPALDNNLNINAMMTFVTLIKMAVRGTNVRSEVCNAGRFCLES